MTQDSLIFERTKGFDDMPTMQKIESLIGAEEFKELARECVRIAPGLLKHNTVDVFTHQCYLFSINGGDGLTTYLELFAELLGKLKLFEFQEKPVVEERLRAPGQGGTDDPFAPVYAHFRRYKNGGGQIVCVDISEWMANIIDLKFQDFLGTIENYRGENIIVFRIPFVEREVLEKLKIGIGDMLYIRDISFVPFDNRELTMYAKEALKRRGFSMEEASWEVFHARITEEKNEGRYYGISTADKVIREMLYRKQLGNATERPDDTVIREEEIAGLSSTYEEYKKTGLQVLDDFVGMVQIKKQVKDIVAQIEAALHQENETPPCIHMRFVGNPGTGKTTVARVIGKVLKEKKILKNGNIFEYSGMDFCGRYVGETAPKTAVMCRDAYGSVLFIDDIYSLYRGDNAVPSDYRKEAIDTLMAEMDNHRSDMVVIMSGYADEMEQLMRGAEGLKSRMPYVIEFPNYTREQLYEIFMMMVERGFSYQDGFQELVRNYFERLPESVISSKEFSNARYVRNLFERTWGKAALRAQLNKEDKNILTREDFALASSEKELRKIMGKQNKAFGFSLKPVKSYLL